MPNTPLTFDAPDNAIYADSALAILERQQESTTIASFMGLSFLWYSGIIAHLEFSNQTYFFRLFFLTFLYELSTAKISTHPSWGRLFYTENNAQELKKKIESLHTEDIKNYITSLNTRLGKTEAITNRLPFISLLLVAYHLFMAYQDPARQTTQEITKILPWLATLFFFYFFDRQITKRYAREKESFQEAEKLFPSFAKEFSPARPTFENSMLFLTLKMGKDIQLYPLNPTEFAYFSLRNANIPVQMNHLRNTLYFFHNHIITPDQVKKANEYYPDFSRSIGFFLEAIERTKQNFGALFPKHVSLSIECYMDSFKNGKLQKLRLPSLLLKMEIKSKNVSPEKIHEEILHIIKKNKKSIRVFQPFIDTKLEDIITQKGNEIKIDAFNAFSFIKRNQEKSLLFFIAPVLEKFFLMSSLTILPKTRQLSEEKTEKNLSGDESSFFNTLRNDKLIRYSSTLFRKILQGSSATQKSEAITWLNGAFSSDREHILEIENTPDVKRYLFLDFNLLPSLSLEDKHRFEVFLQKPRFSTTGGHGIKPLADLSISLPHTIGGQTRNVEIKNEITVPGTPGRLFGYWISADQSESDPLFVVVWYSSRGLHDGHTLTQTTIPTWTKNRNGMFTVARNISEENSNNNNIITNRK